MTEELEKTCENCEYENEDMEGTHCRHCIHNATENFEPKTSCYNEQEIRNKVISEFAESVEINIVDVFVSDAEHSIATWLLKEIAEEMKGGGNSED